MKPTNEERLGRHLRAMNARLSEVTALNRELTERQHEPIAVVGIGCRYPGGVHGADDLWRLVAEGRDAISGMPVNRGWDVAGMYHPDPDVPGRTYSRAGGFLHDADRFDAEFFDISPREAATMDPQQRLLLETAWESLENAGIDPRTLRDTQTGVFVGSNIQDYSHVLASAAEAAEGYVVTGTTGAVVSGRISYVLGLTGPSETVDTACSSSLVAVHRAVQALRNRECVAALAGGATVLTTPRAFSEFSRQRALAPDGRCKAFGAGADGFGLGEGAAVLFLERLSDARWHGHPVLAVIRGSAVNSDGASNGITAPNGPSQERVIRDALAAAAVPADEVDLVETHGTGTRLGDPIEARALLAVYGPAHEKGSPLWIGSVKSNIGHAQAAAGAAGIIKAVMALRHRTLPPTLHADEPTPEVDWSAGTVLPLTAPRPWTDRGHARRAGVSAFGISGTNTHVIVEEAPPAPDRDPDTAADGLPDPAHITPPLVPWLLSGRSQAALRAQAEALLRWTADRPDTPPTAVARALAHTRSRFEHRAVLLGPDADALRGSLTKLAAGAQDGGLVTGEAGAPGRVAFLFSGQGSQRPGMGKELYEAFPVFAAAFDAVCGELDRHLPRPLREVVFAAPGTPEAALLDRTGFAQPGLFAVEIAVFALLRSWGLRPDRLLGHSIGELAAAHVAGVLSLPDACLVVAARGRLMEALPPGGAMAALQATEAEVLALVRDRPGQVAIAAVNGPRSVVVSGDEDTVLELTERWRARGRPAKRLNVSHAFHSPRMDGMLDDFLAVTSSVSYGEPSIPIVSNVTGRLATAAELADPRYWVEHVRKAVRFRDGMAALQDEGVTVFVEVGPDGVLTGMAADCLTRSDVLCLAPLRRNRPETRSSLTALAELHCNGVEVDWGALLSGRGAHLDLPTYPFQRERHWLETPSRVGTAEDASFWSLVAGSDPSAVAAELGVNPDADLATVLPALTNWRERVARQGAADGWWYAVAWRPVPVGAGQTLTGTWLLVGEDGGIGAVLTGLGAKVVHVLPDGTAPDRAGLARQLAGMPAADGVVSTLGLGDGTADTGTPAALRATLALVQALGDAGITAPLWCLTRGSVAVEEGEAPVPGAAALWGLGRVAALERPDRWGGLVDIPPGPVDELGLLLATALTGGEDQLAVRRGTVLARRVVRLPAPTGNGPELPGTVLVTGGTGGLGSRVAQSLAARGTSHLLLVSRRGPDAPGAERLRRELEEAGAGVTIAACDVSDRAALAGLLSGIPANRPLSAVVHAAGVLDDGVLDAQTPQRLASAFAVKSQAAEHLHELTRDADLRAFVLFSSLSGVVGSPGQGNYAAANAHLDALAAQRHALGLPVTAVAWGPWAEDGMVRQAGADRMRQGGLSPMPPDDAVAALWRAVGAGLPSVMIADVEWEGYVAKVTMGRPSPQLADLVTNTAGNEPAATDRLVRDLLGRPLPERRELLLDVVREQVAATLGHDASRGLDPGKSFQGLGFDSLTAVELRNRLTTITGLALPTALVFDHPTPGALAEFLCSELGGGAADGPEPALAQIDRLEAVLGAAELGDEGRAMVAARLSELTRSWSAAPRTGTPVQLDDVDADELIDFITHELGISADRE
ncbi:type I polyketide synthase [Streptomyces avermitilis]